MNILHLTCSPRGSASESYRLSQAIVARLRERHPQARIVARDLAASGLAHIDGDYAQALGQMQLPSRETPLTGSMAQSEVLIRELESSDYVVIGTPMHNFTVPSVLKAWIDHVVRVRRTFTVSREGKIGLLCDRPVFVAIASGGDFSGEDARQPDFLRPYLKAALGIIGLHDLTFFSMEGLGRGTDAAEASMQQALQLLHDRLPLAA